jgi:hypothetical protein
MQTRGQLAADFESAVNQLEEKLDKSYKKRVEPWLWHYSARGRAFAKLAEHRERLAVESLG